MALPEDPEGPIGLSLSGGGYRAMLFHAGALYRLNELGWLRRLDFVSSVSGGSITAGVLAHRWNRLRYEGEWASNFREELIDPVVALSAITIDWKAALSAVLPWWSAADGVAFAYRRWLFGDASLQDLPDEPRFIFVASNLQSGAIWRFSKRYMRDWRVGEILAPDIDVATVVAASSAFPPFLSPLRLSLDPNRFTPRTGHDLQRPPYTRAAILSDGGVYDNLGLEPVWKRCPTVLISDGGQKLAASTSTWPNWFGQMRRVLYLMDDQVRSLRKRNAIDAFKENGRKSGTYWGIRTDILDYELPDALVCPHAEILRLAEIKTGLRALDLTQARDLINWGYAVCDAAMRRHVLGKGALPASFPFPTSWPSDPPRKIFGAWTAKGGQSEGIRELVNGIAVRQGLGLTKKVTEAFVDLTHSVAPRDSLTGAFPHLEVSLGRDPSNEQNEISVEECETAWKDAPFYWTPRLQVTTDSWTALAQTFDFEAVMRSFEQALKSRGGNVGSLWFAWPDKDVSGRDSKWNWPLRVGTLDDAASLKLRSEIKLATRSYYATLCTFIDLDANNRHCDILLLPGPLDQAVEKLDGRDVDAAFVAIFDKFPRATSLALNRLSRIRQLATAASLAIVPGVSDRAKWFGSLVEELSHNASLDVALWRCVGDAPLVLGDARFFDGTTLTTAHTEFANRLRKRSPKRADELDTRFGGESFNSEMGTATDVVCELATEADNNRNRTPRYIDGRLLGFDRLRRLRPRTAMAPQRWHLVEVRIRPMVEGEPSLGASFPEALLPAEEVVHELTVALASLDGFVRPLASNLAVDWQKQSRVVADVRRSVSLFRQSPKWRPKQPASSTFEGATMRLEPEPGRSAAGTIRLPANGSSTSCLFAVAADRAGPVMLRIMVAHSNRVLQTAVIECDAGSRTGSKPIQARAEAVVHADLVHLEERPRFETAFIVNHTPLGVPAVTSITDRVIRIRNAEQLFRKLAPITRELERVVGNEKSLSALESEETRSVLVNLAAEGVDIRDVFINDTELADHMDKRRFQIVSMHKEAYLPLEFAYERPAPHPWATVCGNAKTALAAGSCGGCPNRKSKEHVCPMRFLGFSAVIERHMFTRDDGSESAPFQVRFSSKRQDGRLGPFPAAVFGASSRAGKISGAAAVAAVVKQLGSCIGDVSKVREVANWKDWNKAVRELYPTLLVLVPHNDKDDELGTLLEIGTDRRRRVDVEPEMIVGVAAGEQPNPARPDPFSPPRLVCLFGCSTIAETTEFQDYPATFRRAGAKVIVGSLCRILGRHALPVAEAFVKELEEQFATKPNQEISLGDSMLRLRRSLLLKGYPTVLTLVAYGDADWLLGRRR